MKNWIINLLIVFSTSLAFSQTFPEGISYQAQLKGANGDLLTNQLINIEFNLRVNTLNGTIVWQETHQVTTNNLGHITLNIGEGTSTGLGTYSLFSDIDWETGIYFIELLLDENHTGNYLSITTQQLMAVPFAFHSKTTSQTYQLNQLTDVDTSGIQIGDVLKWDGVAWIPQKDSVNNTCSDTLNFAYYSDSANYATTANYAYNCIQSSLVDSSNYSYYSDTSSYSFTSNYSLNSDSSVYADTSNVANYSIGNWGLNGNDISSLSGSFIGTTNPEDLVFKTNNTERMRLTTNGRIGIGTNTPLTDFHINNGDGFLITGIFGNGTIPTQGAGTRLMWYPAKGAFRSGRVTGTTWDNANVGDYSFASGYNTRASGNYSVAFGNASYSSAEGAFAVGNQAAATGIYSFAAGHNPQATGPNSIALGRGGIASDSSSIAIGYHPTASGKFAMCFSNYGTASGNNSVAMGYHANSTHDGSFVYADKSTETDLNSTAENQFMVRASGGTIFYTSSDLSTGVVLAAGAGAWSILSDSTKKENIKPITLINYLDKLNTIEVYSWNYKSQSDSITHIGPMAQDFHATFNLGNDPTTINSGDFDGINLVLLKGLNQKLAIIENQNQKIEELEQELETLITKRLALEKMLIELNSKMN